MTPRSRYERAQHTPKLPPQWIRIVDGRLAGWGTGEPPDDLPVCDAVTGKVIRDAQSA